MTTQIVLSQCKSLPLQCRLDCHSTNAPTPHSRSEVIDLPGAITNSSERIMPPVGKLRERSAATHVREYLRQSSAQLRLSNLFCVIKSQIQPFNVARVQRT